MVDTSDLIPFSIRKSQNSGLTKQQINKKRVQVYGRQIAYLELGVGDPIVFLHDNLCSSYLWRDVVPVLAPTARCIALDLPGFGDSEPATDIASADQFLNVQLELFSKTMSLLDVHENVTLVMCGMSTMIGCTWAYRNYRHLKGIAHIGGCFTDSSRLAGDPHLEQYRTVKMQEYMLTEDDFVEVALSAFLVKPIPADVLQEYCRPFTQGAFSRAGIIGWLLCIPSCGYPRASHDLVTRYTNWLRCTELPKLRLQPTFKQAGFLNSYQVIADGFPAQESHELEGSILLPEDNAVGVARAIERWYAKL